MAYSEGLQMLAWQVAVMIVFLYVLCWSSFCRYDKLLRNAESERGGFILTQVAEISCSVWGSPLSQAWVRPSVVTAGMWGWGCSLRQPGSQGCTDLCSVSIVLSSQEYLVVEIIESGFFLLLTFTKVPERKSVMVEEADAGTGSLKTIFNHTQDKGRVNCKWGWILTLKTHPNDVFPPTKPDQFYKQGHQLGIKCSDIWASGGHFSFKLTNTIPS